MIGNQALNYLSPREITAHYLNFSVMTDIERHAVERVQRARVKAPEEVILSFVRCSGPESILATKLCDIRAIANAF